MVARLSRAEAYAALGQYQKALEDAEFCCRLEMLQKCSAEVGHWRMLQRHPILQKTNVTLWSNNEVLLTLVCMDAYWQEINVVQWSAVKYNFIFRLLLWKLQAWRLIFAVDDHDFLAEQLETTPVVCSLLEVNVLETFFSIQILNAAFTFCFVFSKDFWSLWNVFCFMIHFFAFWLDLHEYVFFFLGYNKECSD